MTEFSSFRYLKRSTHQDLMDDYRIHIEKFLDHFFSLSQGKTHLVIMSSLPVSKHCGGAFLTDDVDGDTKNNLG